MNILNIGHVCIDHNVSENAEYTAPGSPGMFMSKIFAQLPNCSFTIVAPYGADYLKYLEHIKIYPEKPTADKTLIYENITLPGKQRIQKACNREFAKYISIDAGLTKLIQTSDIIIISPLLPNFSVSYLKEIHRLVLKETLIMLLPQGYFRNFDQDNRVIFRKFIEADEILSCINLMIISKEDYPNIDNLPKEWAKNSGITVIETLSDKGALIISKNNQVHIPTLPVATKDIVDSVGAGDTFAAALSYWYKKTDKLEEAVRFGNKAARQRLFFTPDKIKIDLV